MSSLQYSINARRRIISFDSRKRSTAQLLTPTGRKGGKRDDQDRNDWLAESGRRQENGGKTTQQNPPSD